MRKGDLVIDAMNIASLGGIIGAKSEFAWHGMESVLEVFDEALSLPQLVKYENRLDANNSIKTNFNSWLTNLIIPLTFTFVEFDNFTMFRCKVKKLINRG